jgi:putative alpha-1,2-mannosidase
MKKAFIILFSFILFGSTFSQNLSLSDFVNTSIGTGGHGHTFPGAVAPFGMVQLSPDTRNDASWDGCGGYYYRDSFIYGFSHTHLSGTGVSDFGDILFQPMTEPTFNPEDYKATFTHHNEITKAGFYAVSIDDSNIRVELTTTPYTGYQKYTFSGSGDHWVLVDLEHRDKLLSHHWDIEKVTGGVKIRGHRQSEQWANNQWVFFESEISSPVREIRFNKEKTKALLRFDVDQIMVRTTLSFTGMDGVDKNKKATRALFADADDNFGLLNIPQENEFIQAREWCRSAWNAELSRIEIEPESDLKKIGKQQVSPAKYGQLWSTMNDSVTATQKVTFYTALYHCMIHPSLASDADGSYRGRDQLIHKAKHRYYHVFSLWDTYRALHPLLSLINKQRTKEFILTMLLQYEQGGRLPVWELGSCETDCMIGFHSVPVIADAVLQGIEFDSSQRRRIMNAVIHSSNYKEKSYTYEKPIPSELLTLYGLKLGYIDVLKESESVSKHLEYAYDDYCAFRLARYWEMEEERFIFQKRSERWKGLFDLETRSFRPKKNGQWLQRFRLNEVNNHYTEANAWQYRFAVPHAIPSLIEAFGGKGQFELALDSLFGSSPHTTGRDQADITGLIGQYAHGNEPSHHMAYLYNAIGQPQKAQRILRKIKQEFYTDKPDGYIGNEDCGQMSAWYVLSSLGMYPVAPSSNEWYLGEPSFHRARIQMEDGKDILITKDTGMVNFADGYFTVSSEKASGHYRSKFGTPPEYYHRLLPQDNIMSQAFLMIHRQIPFEYVSKKQSKDQTWLSHKIFQSNLPEISAPLRVKKDQKYQVKIKGDSNRGKWVFIRFMDSALNFPRAKEGFWIHSRHPQTQKGQRIPGYGAHHLFFYLFGADTVLNLKGSALAWASYAFDYNRYDFTATYIHEKPNNYSVLSITGDYNSQYSAGGDEAIVDGVIGSSEWRSGGWQGFQGQDISYLIDLQKPTELKHIQLRFLRDERAWIFYPTSVLVEFSKDGLKYKTLDEITDLSNFRGGEVGVFPLTMSPKSPPEARFLRVKANAFGRLPKGHPGYEMGGEAFIFTDEVLINPPMFVELQGR